MREFFSERQLWPDKTRTAFSKSELFDKGLPLQLPPFACSLLVCRPVEEGFSAAEGSGLVTYASDLRSAESNLREQLENQYNRVPNSGCRAACRRRPRIADSSQTLVHLDEGLTCHQQGWQACTNRHDWFVEPVLVLTDNHAELSELKFSGDELQAEFAIKSRLLFEGLIFRKRYILGRNRTAVNVQISIEPVALSPFRYRLPTS